MTVKMAGVRRLSAQPEALSGKGNSHNVNDRFGSVGENRRGSGHPVGEYFRPEHEEADRKGKPHGELGCAGFVGGRDLHRSHHARPNRELTPISGSTIESVANHTTCRAVFQQADR